MTDSHSLETLTAEDFRAHRGTRFRLTGGPSRDGSPASFAAELTEVDERAASAPGTSRTPFSVVFHGPLQPVFPQGNYRLEHEHFGGLELFVVPIGPNETPPGEKPTAMRYEVVFG